MISKKKAIIYGVLLVVITFLITSTLNIALGGKVVISKETYEAYKKTGYNYTNHRFVCINLLPLRK